jgi:predicted MFS family arabinose efflux permease
VTLSGPGRWRSALLVAVLCTAQALEVLGVTVVIVALPEIGADLALPDSQLQLVVSLYAVLYGSLLLTAGRVADIVDRRLVFAVGIGLTLAGAVCCAVAGSATVLLVGRAVQDQLPTGWRGVFWMLTPIAAVVLVTMWLVVPTQTPVRQTTGQRRGLDLAGWATATTGLVLLVWGAGLVEHPDTAPLAPALVLGLGMALLLGFLLIERRSRDPLIRWSELTRGPFMRANGCAFVNTATTSASGTLVALVAYRVLDLSPRETGLVLLPFSIAVVLGSTTGAFWLRRPLEHGMASGLAVVAIAMLALAAATATESVTALAAAVGLAGLGLSWAAVTSTSAATAALAQHRQGVAAAAVNTAAQIGTALGVAVLLSVAATASGPVLGCRAAGA